jgi:O-antigen ligase
MSKALLANSISRASLASIADGLAACVAVALPWSTSATEILIVLWLIAVLPTLDAAAVRREVMSAAGGLPVLLWALGALGMLWADTSFSERAAGLGGFHKLLVVPLLLAQFRRSGQAHWAIHGFLASALVLLIVSWILVLAPGLSWRGKGAPGIPVRDYVMQNTIFAICAFGLIGKAAEIIGERRAAAAVLSVAAALFLADIFYVAAARTTLVVLPVLLLAFGLRQFGWKGLLGTGLSGVILAGAIWGSSPYLRARVTAATEETFRYEAGHVDTSEGLRLGFWRKSIGFIAEAPLVGHGTGTIAELFRRNAAAEPALVTSNPHNQILTVAIQLGLLGAATLVAMWIAHAVLFGEATLIAWFGRVVVLHNVVGSLFNSFLFDSGQGWLYVFAIGILGGTMLHARHGVNAEQKPP